MVKIAAVRRLLDALGANHRTSDAIRDETLKLAGGAVGWWRKKTERHQHCS
jgi:hypothetical protein